MSIAQPEIQAVSVAPQRQVNNFGITVATINGSGSQTSNSALMRAILKMGVPVSGKNLFPSNIHGLPTWFSIRVSQAGYMARCDDVDIVVALNPESFAKDLASLHPGGAFYYADHIKQPITRNDVVVYPMPIHELSRASSTPSSLLDYIANMVYVGVLAHMLGIDLSYIRQALDFHFKGKQKAVDLNYSVVEASARWASENLVKKDPYCLEPMNATQDYFMMDGNTAAALGALYGGVQFAGWYPITPASSLAEGLMEYAPQLRKDPETGKTTVVIVQAEDELAAIGMTIGAGWGGLRAMTSTSGPGLSLMAEYAGLAYFAEVPIVVWDVQRVGPATGLPTRTAQADLTFVNFLAHGDTQYVMLLPGSVNECFEYGWKAFDLAEQLQTPVFVLSDLDFGMNNWMTRPFEYPDRPMQRGKVLWESDLERLNGQWSRYLDLDQDGIPYRTLPGNRHPQSAYFTRGTGHDENAHYSEDPAVWERVLERLRKKYETARGMVPEPVLISGEGAEFGIISFGSCDPAVMEARDYLAKDGIQSDYLRIRALPFTKEVSDFIHSHAYTYVVELNRDGQMHQLLSLEVPDCAARLISLAHLDGLPLTADWVEKAVRAHETAKEEAYAND